MTENAAPTLVALTAHPDDESLGMGGTLAHYAAAGVEAHVVCATRGQAGRYRDGTDHPGPDALGRIREAELRAAADVLGVRSVTVLDHPDGGLDRQDPHAVVGDLVAHLRRLRPDVVITFDPFGAYGHPDHIAICQFATAAVAAAHDADVPGGTPHAVAKLYYMVWPAPTWAAYQATFKKLVSRVDGVERQAVPWPDWSITTSIETGDQWETVWKAVRCHESQMLAYGPLGNLTPEHHRGLWGSQHYYRALSRVNGGRVHETDLFAGIEGAGPAAAGAPSRSNA
ncbi:MAG: PIG-L family deacetylase [Gemmatimonadota bacterium]